MTPGVSPDSSRRLFDLVYHEALPGGGRDGLTAADVLAELWANPGECRDSFVLPTHA